MLKKIILINIFLISLCCMSMKGEVYLTNYDSSLLITPSESTELSRAVCEFYINEYTQILNEFKNDLDYYELEEDLKIINLHYYPLRNQFTISEQYPRLLYKFICINETILVKDLKEIIKKDVEKIDVFTKKWINEKERFPKDGFFDNYKKSDVYLLQTNKGAIKSNSCEFRQTTDKFIIKETISIMELVKSGQWITKTVFDSPYIEEIMETPYSHLTFIKFPEKCQIETSEGKQFLRNYPRNYRLDKEEKKFERVLELSERKFIIKEKETGDILFLKSWVKIEGK